MLRCWKEEHLSDIYGADSWNMESLQASVAALNPCYFYLIWCWFEERAASETQILGFFSTHCCQSCQISQSQTSLVYVGRG